MGVPGDVVSADPAPDEMRFAGLLPGPVGECGAAVRRPGHRGHARRGPGACDPRPGPEHAACQVGHELAGDDTLLPRPWLRGELLPVALEPPRDLEGRHFWARWSWSATMSCALPQAGDRC